MNDSDFLADSPTEIRRVELYQDRWTALGASAGILELSEKPTVKDLKAFELFSGIDDALLEEISPDVSICRWKAGSVLFEEGSYIDIAFFLAEGQVDIFLSKDEQPNAPIFDASRTIAIPQASTPPDQTVADSPLSVYEAQIQQQQSGFALTMLSVMDFDLPKGSTIRLESGEIFGEIGALSGWPQSVTARTQTECVLVQLRLPALRKLKKSSNEFKERADLLYRERSLFYHLRTIPLLEPCGDTYIRSLCNKVELVSCKPDEVVVNEGDAMDALYLVRSGFLKLTQKVAAGKLTVTYLSKGMTLGEAELLIDDLDAWTASASAVGYAELVKISKRDMTLTLQQYPGLQEQLWQASVDRIKETGYSRRNLDHSELIDFSLSSGLVQGNSILVIDLNTCTRCDDCVRACADTHDGRPRFVREGERYGQFLITQACYHCRDPLCLIGCPTGAIHRAEVGEVVEIQEGICIGCSSCANKCPYQAITMVDTGKTWPQNALPELLRGKEQQVASKCDLCYTSAQGPACVQNCPHGCAIRVGTIEEFRALSEKKT